MIAKISWSDMRSEIEHIYKAYDVHGLALDVITDFAHREASHAYDRGYIAGLQQSTQEAKDA